MSKVVIKKCSEYDVDLIYSHIKDSIMQLGDINDLIKKDSRVFIKLNCIGPFEKDTGICTHPAVTEAVIKLVLEQTSNIIIGDNPATKDIVHVLKKNGNYDVIQKYNLQIINGHDVMTITNSNPHIYSKFEVAREMMENDVIINLPKLKTHTLTYMTGAQKNFFGSIFGLQKASWHAKASNPLEFGEAINDLFGAILETHKGPIISILDGILGLDGEGPSTGGEAKKANVLLTSLDVVSLDTLACRLVKLDENRIFITNISESRGYGNKNIEILGDSFDDFQDLHFKGPKNTITSFGLRLIRHKVFRNILLEHPVIDHNKCIRCGECTKICPAKTMKIIDKKYPHLNTRDCIRCWCCAEVCPQDAISKSHRPLVGKILF